MMILRPANPFYKLLSNVCPNEVGPDFNIARLDLHCMEAVITFRFADDETGRFCEVESIYYV